MLFAFLLGFALSRRRSSHRGQRSRDISVPLPTDPLHGLKALPVEERVKILNRLRDHAQAIARDESKRLMTSIRKKNLKNMVKLGMMREAGLPAASLVRGDAQSMLPLLLMFDKPGNAFSNSADGKRSYQDVMREAEELLQSFD